jgi:membrane fusion protein (multidrug efflux system)
MVSYRKQKRVSKTKNRYRRIHFLFALIMLCLLAGFSYWHLCLGNDIDCDDAYVAGNIIPVHALVPGIVTNIYTDNTMYVNANQVLVRQERHLAKQRLDKSSSALAETIRFTRSQYAQVRQTVAAVSSLYAQREKLEGNLLRYTKAESGGAASAQKVADTRADIAIIDNDIEAAKANHQKALALTGKSTVLNHPSVQKLKAEFIENYILYRRSEIASPVSGYVANRRVQIGQSLENGQLLMHIIPLDGLWITANIKETDMHRVQPGQDVTVNASMYGNAVTYHGKVLGIEPAGGSTFSLFPPENTTGNYIHIVERVPVRISLSKQEIMKHPLRPGLSVRVKIFSKIKSGSESLISHVTVDSPSFSTSIYKNEMNDALSAVQTIMNKN